MEAETKKDYELLEQDHVELTQAYIDLQHKHEALKQAYIALQNDYRIAAVWHRRLNC